MTTWAREEMETANLGGRRLDERLAILLGQFGDHPQLSIPNACGGWAETVAAYRFFAFDFFMIMTCIHTLISEGQVSQVILAQGVARLSNSHYEPKC